jgi:probable rRNA maturation factor
MVNVIISDDYIDQINEKQLTLAAMAVLEVDPKAIGQDLSVVIDADNRLRELNLQFLDIDAPTDVLSFPSGEIDPDPETGRIYLGDVIISYPRAVEQAGAAGHSVHSELQLLTTHGVLHLLGYDHAEEDEKALMWETQSTILRSLGVEIKHLPE